MVPCWGPPTEQTVQNRPREPLLLPWSSKRHLRPKEAKHEEDAPIFNGDLSGSPSRVAVGIAGHRRASSLRTTEETFQLRVI